MADLYLLDANAFITAHALYYPLDRVPQYWAWLVKQAQDGFVKIPIENFKEITPPDTDKLFKGWLKEHQQVLVLPDPNIYQARISEVTRTYGDGLTDRDLEKMTKDPIFIAAALELGAIAVTREVSSPGKTMGNRKIPDVCKDLKVRCINDHKLIRELDFRI